MRVALLPSAYAPSVGGVEQLTARLAAHLVAGGDEVEVWAPRWPDGVAAEDVVDGVAVRRLAMALPPARPGALARFPLAAGPALARLLGLVRAFRPDVLHVQCASANLAFASAASVLARVPLVVTLQGETVMDDFDVYERSSAMRGSLRLGLRRAAAVTGCSRFVLDDAARFGLASGAGEVVPNGVDVVEAPVGPRVGGATVVAYGRVVDKKGFDLLVEGFATVVVPACPGARLVIGGDGPALAGLRHQAASLGVADAVELPGRLGRVEVAAQLARAAVFVLPSRVEPFGIVVLEALAAGVPAVVSGVGGAGEVVRHEVEGLVAPPTPAALGAAVLRLLTDRALAASLATAGRERVAAYDWPVVTERYRAVYERVVHPRA